MSKCFTWFPISGLEEPNIYHDLGVFYKNIGFYLEGICLCEELSGGYLELCLTVINLPLKYSFFIFFHKKLIIDITSW